MQLSQEEIHSLEASRENLERFFPVQRIGPTWDRDGDGLFVQPERTLGWHVLAWIEENLTAFDGDGPFVPTPEQARFILWFYALEENEHGHVRFKYETSVLQRCKGWGKDPLAAVLCMVELVGPCVYWKTVDGFDLGRSNPVAEVGLGAVSLDQTANTRSLFQPLVPKRTRVKYSMEIQKETIHAGQGQKLKAFGTSARSMEGHRLTFFIANETHHWVPAEGGPDFYNTITGNLAKVPYPRQGRMLCITNAYKPGEGSQAELTREGQQKVWDGRAAPTGVLYDSLEAHPSTPMTKSWVPLVLEQVRGDASWLHWENIKSEILRTDLPLSRKRRMWYNQVVADEESLFDLRDIDRVTDESMLGSRKDLVKGDVITLGFDGGRTDDATALVAFRPSDQLLVPIAVWEKPEDAEFWQVNAARVDSMVHWVFSQFEVQAFYADVALWETYIDGWSEQYRERLVLRASADSAVRFDMRGHRKKVAKNNETFVSAVRDGRVKLNGSKVMRRHMLNAEARYDAFGLKFGKKGGRESPRKIDALVAGSLAFMAGRDLVEKRSERKPRYRGVLTKG